MASRVAEAMVYIIRGIHNDDLLAWALGDSRPILGAGTTKSGADFAYYFWVDEAAFDHLERQHGRGLPGLAIAIGASLELGFQAERALPALVKGASGGPRRTTAKWLHEGGVAWLLGTCMPHPEPTGVPLTDDALDIGIKNLQSALAGQIREALATSSTPFS